MKAKCKSMSKLNIKMIKFGDHVNENKTEHNPKWPYTPDHP